MLFLILLILFTVYAVEKSQKVSLPKVSLIGILFYVLQKKKLLVLFWSILSIMNIILSILGIYKNNDKRGSL